MNLRHRPEEIGRQISPQGGPDEHGYGQKLAVSDAAMALVEQLLTVVPPAWQRDSALRRLRRAVDLAHRAIDRHPDDPLQYDIVEQPPAADPTPVEAAVSGPAPAPAVGPGGVGMRSMWLAGVLSPGSRLQPLARLVACALAAAADESGTFPERSQPTLPGLRADTGLATFQLHLILRDLDRAGWIDRQQPAPDSPKGALTRYWLALPPAASEPETET